MDRITIYEKRYTKLHMIVLLFVLCYIFFSLFRGFKLDPSFTILIGIAWVLQGIKSFVIHKNIYSKYHIFHIIKASELFVAALLAASCEDINNWRSSIYLLIAIEAIISNEMSNNMRHAIYNIIPFIITMVIAHFEQIITFQGFVYLFFQVAVIFLCTYIVGWTVKEIKIKSRQNEELLRDTQSKNMELISVKEQMEQMNQELSRQKVQLQETNEGYRRSLAEFYILREIGNYIGSTLDVKQLLAQISDIIMGLMGTDTCSIILYDEQTEQLEFHINTIYSQDIIDRFKEKTKNGLLLKWIINNEVHVDNYAKTREYVFTEGRDVGSFVAVPLYKGDRSYGLILVEHSIEEFFSKSTIQLFKTLSTQVTMAIENAKLYQKMQEMATKDGLTGVYNRMFLQKKLPMMFEQARAEETSLSAAIFDIDHFKKFNDAYGHLFGDRVIQIVSKLAKEKVEKYHGIIARYGGEEFVLLFPKLNVAVVKDIVEELRREIEAYKLEEEDIQTYITASFGISSYPLLVSTENDLLKSADDAMYRAKKLGRNQVIIAKKQ